MGGSDSCPDAEISTQTSVKWNAPTQKAWLDYQSYPHLVDEVFCFAHSETVHAFRRVSKHFRRLPHPRFPRHLAWNGKSWDIAVKRDGSLAWHPQPDIKCIWPRAVNWYKSFDWPVPSHIRLSPLDGIQTHQELWSILRHTSVLDFRTSLVHTPDAGRDWCDLFHIPSGPLGLNTSLPCVRIWTAGCKHEPNDTPPVLEVDAETLVVCNFNSETPQVCTGGDQDPNYYALEMTVQFRGYFSRLVIHVGFNMLYGIRYCDLLSAYHPKPHYPPPSLTRLVLFFDDLEDRIHDREALALFLSAFLVPMEWWDTCDREDPESYDGFENARSLGTAEPGIVGHCILVDAERPACPNLLRHLGDTFGVSTPSTTLAELVRAVGDEWYGREELDKRCTFFTREEYEAHIGTERFKIEDGVVDFT